MFCFDGIIDNGVIDGTTFDIEGDSNGVNNFKYCDNVDD
jgi:hypothetical protein